MEFKAKNYQTAIEAEFTIINKEKIEVPFVLKSAQENFLNNMGETLDIIILKARKMGFSSVILAVAVLKFIFGENERCVSMSFDTTSAGKQLDRAKHFLRSFELKNGLKLPLKYNSKSEIVYEGINKQTNRPYTNTLRIGTAKSNSFGRGDDITFLHITEAAYCDDMDVLLSGVGEAIVTGAHKILETTANGFNQFKTFWDKAVLNENGYRALFYGSEWEYNSEYLEQKEKNLGRLFMQEYPKTAEEAFLTSGETYFNNQVLGEILKGCKEPITFQFI